MAHRTFITHFSHASSSDTRSISLTSFSCKCHDIHKYRAGHDQGKFRTCLDRWSHLTESMLHFASLIQFSSKHMKPVLKSLLIFSLSLFAVYTLSCAIINQTCVEVATHDENKKHNNREEKKYSVKSGCVDVRVREKKNVNDREFLYFN